MDRIVGSSDSVDERAMSGEEGRDRSAARDLTAEMTTKSVGDDQLERLFERFYRVEEGRSRAGGGSGLGLSICHSIAAAHGGRIRAARSSLGGLAVHLELPA